MSECVDIGDDVNVVIIVSLVSKGLSDVAKRRALIVIRNPPSFSILSACRT